MSEDVYWACKFCVQENGLNGQDVPLLPKTEAEMFAHIEGEHHIAVRREGESREEARARMLRTYPEAGNPKTCKCEECRMKRLSSQ